MLYFTPIRLSLCGLILLISGCATMIRGMDQPLQMMSEPPGARAALGTGQSCTTPCSITASRSTSTIVTFEKDGCERAMVSVFPTLAGAGVILGGVIDYGTGAVYNLQPNPVMANLRCVLGTTPLPSQTSNRDTVPQPAPAVIVPALHQANEPAMYNDTSSADVQLRNLDREFRAGRIGIDEYRQMKKVLTGE